MTLEVTEFTKGQRIIIEVIIDSTLAEPDMVPHQVLKSKKQLSCDIKQETLELQINKRREEERK